MLPHNRTVRDMEFFPFLSRGRIAFFSVLTFAKIEPYLFQTFSTDSIFSYIISCAFGNRSWFDLEEKYEFFTARWNKFSLLTSRSIFFVRPSFERHGTRTGK